MSLSEIITLIIALWGMVLSTILAIREFKKENARLKIFLIHIQFEERFKLSIVNIYNKPVKVIDIALSILNKGENHNQVELIPRGSRFDNIPECKFR